MVDGDSKGATRRAIPPLCTHPPGPPLSRPSSPFPPRLPPLARPPTHPLHGARPAARALATRAVAPTPRAPLCPRVSARGVGLDPTPVLYASLPATTEPRRPGREAGGRARCGAAGALVGAGAGGGLWGGPGGGVSRHVAPLLRGRVSRPLAATPSGQTSLPPSHTHSHTPPTLPPEAAQRHLQVATRATGARGLPRARRPRAGCKGRAFRLRARPERVQRAGARPGDPLTREWRTVGELAFVRRAWSEPAAPVCLDCFGHALTDISDLRAPTPARGPHCRWSRVPCPWHQWPIWTLTAETHAAAQQASTRPEAWPGPAGRGRVRLAERVPLQRRGVGGWAGTGPGRL